MSGKAVMLKNILAVCGLMALAAGCEQSASRATTSKATTSGAKATENPANSQSQPTDPDAVPATARDVLERMVAAYRGAEGYSDAGRLDFRLQIAGEEEARETPPFAASFARPNKLRMEVYQTVLVCDGDRWRARIDHPGISNDVLDGPAPAKLSLEKIYEDEILFSSLTGGLAGGALQPLLLLGDDPLKQMLDGNPSLELLEPEKIGDRNCLRVAAHREDGDLIFWIDEAEYLLRRLDFPTQGLKQMLTEQTQSTIDAVSLRAEFHDARFVPPEEDAFVLDLPAGAELVERFNPRKVDNPPPPPPSSLLGHQAPDFEFVALDGEKITRESLQGKTVVIGFWATLPTEGQSGLPILAQIYEKVKDDENVRFLAVSIDTENVTNDKLEDALTAMKVDVPVARATHGDVLALFDIEGIPNLFLLGTDGVVQDNEPGANPALVDAIPARIEKLAAGESLHAEALARHEQRLADYRRSLEEGDSIPLAEIAPRSDPAKIKLTKLWTAAVASAAGAGGDDAAGEDTANDDGEDPDDAGNDAASLLHLTEPGNLLVIDQNGSPLILVNDGWRSVAEIDAQGTVLAKHELAVPDDQIVAFLRTAVDAEDRRLFVGAAGACQKLYVFDAAWQPKFSYPEEANADVADVAFADLEADGQPELYVSFWGVVGVHRVGLDGRRAWGNREVENALRIAPAALDGQLGIACVNIASTGSSLTVISPAGKKLRDVRIEGRNLVRIESADLDGDGQLEYCGVDAPKPGAQSLVGLDIDGSELWEHPLATGIHEAPIEFVAAAKLLPGGKGHWLAAGPDGALLFIAANGELLDSFHYGAALTGLATTEIDGQPVLLVSTRQGVDAWQVGE